jgi:arylsulfate sulfotransferase
LGFLRKKAVEKSTKILLCLAGAVIRAGAALQIVSFTPSLQSPQLIGTPITWTAIATDSNAGPLTFQFNVAPSSETFTNGLVKDFNVGTLSGGTWTSQPFVWVPTQGEGAYQIQVVIKDFASGESASQTAQFQINPLVTGSTPVVVATANPLVALFSAPACPLGSSMRVYVNARPEAVRMLDKLPLIQQHSTSPPVATTNWANCHEVGSMTFEIAGMYPSTTYEMYAQTHTGRVVTNGPVVEFTTGALPANITFPTFTTIVAPGSQTDTALPVLLRDATASLGNPYMAVATDLSGKIIWYYTPYAGAPYVLITRPLVNGGMLSIQDGVAWNPASQWLQLVRQTDLAGNIIRETNTGAIQQQLLALGATGLGPCNAFPSPAPVGASCLGAFHHDVIETLPNGYTALLADVEQIFPPGTQGDTSGLPVDIEGDAIVVLNQNWQAVWYFNTFQHDGGCPQSGPCQLNINRAAVLGETCGVSQPGCPPMFLLGPGIAPLAKDWLHANSLYYWPTDNFGGASGDIIWSSRNQDWIMKIDYNNGAGSGDILWRMGKDGDFTFNNIYNDSWPWFSHQHQPGIEDDGTGVMSIFDDGNTRVSGLGSPACEPSDCHSRGMALTFDESTMQVTPVLSADLGTFSTAMGSAQLLPDGNYFFMSGWVVIHDNLSSYALEIAPTAGADSGTTVMNVEEGDGEYRAWQVTNLYNPP